MKLEVTEGRTAVAARGVSLALVVVMVGLVVIGAALLSQPSFPAGLVAHSSGPSLGSSSVPAARSLTAQSSSVSTNSSLSQSAVQYPLVWGPSPISGCSEPAFCITATLGFSGQTASNGSASPTTTTIQGNATTIVHAGITTVISLNATSVRYPSPASSYFVDVIALVQDAVTGQNASTPNGLPIVSSGCYIQPTGFTGCTVGAPYVPRVPSGHPIKVTVFVTKSNYFPCSWRNDTVVCSSGSLLAPPSPAISVGPYY